MRRRVLFVLLRQALIVCLLAPGCLSQTNERAGRSRSPGAGSSPADAASVSALIRESAIPLTGKADDYDALMNLVGDARFVLLGEATHGTHEFYRERARITRRLIEEKGFDAVVLEADWPDAYRVNEYVRGRGADADAGQALAAFKRFPVWMWRNADFRDLVAWLRSHNDAQPADARVGVYGMDLYSFSGSSKAVVEYLKRVDPQAGARARKRTACFRSYGERPERYGYDVAAEMKSSCEQNAAAQLREMQQLFTRWRSRPRPERNDELFSAYQNARALKNGEAYYRLSYRGGFSTWNLRDSHMAETLREISKYEEAVRGESAKLVVWAHNTHQGDARMTAMGEERGELSLGHLMRQFHAGASVLVGFTTYEGEVRAATAWGMNGQKMKVRPALAESYSGLFHETGVPNFLLILRGGGAVSETLAGRRLERAIGVVYLPDTERQSHYFNARLSKQFDAVIHLDKTSAVVPLK